MVHHLGRSGSLGDAVGAARADYRVGLAAGAQGVERRVRDTQESDVQEQVAGYDVPGGEGRGMTEAREFEFVPFNVHGSTFGWTPNYDGIASMVARCPVCGGDNVHMDTFEEELGWESKRDRDIEDDTPAHYRGDGVRLIFWGECDHNFAVILQQHKGNTFVWCERLPDDDGR